MRNPGLIIFVACIAVMMFCPSAFALTLPDTGQTSCYDSAGNVLPSCVGTGQDGAYSNNPRSYKDNSDGTVTDNVTGLIWQKCSAGQDELTCSGSAVSYTWYEAVDVCGELNNQNFGGYTGWRLPAKKELITLADYSIPYPGPAIDAVFNNSIASFYWASSHPYFSDSAWVANFMDGLENAYAKSTGGDVYVRCVVGEETTQSLTDNGDGTVTDKSTGLVWQKCSSGQNNDSTCSYASEGSMMWDEALIYCNNLSLGDKTDWRLPNITEFDSLPDNSRYNPAIDPAYFPNTYSSSHLYWSSTSYAYSPDYAIVMSFYSGDITEFAKSYDSWVKIYARCVRGVSCAAKTVKISDTAAEYDFIQPAYDTPASPKTILARNVPLDENLIFASNKIITLIGGYNCGFTAQSSFTTIKGRLTIGGTDKVTISKIIIK
jgi:hypothetical protein